MYPNDENEALAAVAAAIKDNTTGDITPAVMRTALAGVIAHTKNLPPNFSPGADLRCRFETAAQLLAAGGVGAGDCLEGENDANFCLGMLGWVEFPLRGYGVTFRLMYDPNPARTVGDAGVWAYRTGRMVVGSRLPARWVRLDDPIAGVPTYASLQAIAGVGGYEFAVDQPVRDFAGGNAEYFFAAKLAGPLPAPTSASGDANWRRISPEQLSSVAPPFFLRISRATAIALNDDEAAQSAVRYAVDFGAAGYVELVGTEARRFPKVGILNGEPVRADIHTGTIGPVGGPTLRPGSVIRFDVNDAIYGQSVGGTFTVDTTGARPGYTVMAHLDNNSSEIVLPSSGFSGVKNSSSYVNGAWNIYVFVVGPDGVIDYTISQRS